MATTGLGAQKFKVSSLSTFCANFSVSLLLWGPPLCQVGQGTNPVMSVAQLPRKPAATSDSFCCFLQKQCKHYRACHSTPSPSAKPHALHPLTSVHLPYRDGGCTSPLPQHCWAQMQTGTIRPQAQRWGPSHTHCPPRHPTPRLTKLQPQGLRPTGNRSQEEAAVCRHRRGGSHAPCCTGSRESTRFTSRGLWLRR